jgi:hypothetical protein
MQIDLIDDNVLQCLLQRENQDERDNNLAVINMTVQSDDIPSKKNESINKYQVSFEDLKDGNRERRRMSTLNV